MKTPKEQKKDEQEGKEETGEATEKKGASGSESEGTEEEKKEKKEEKEEGKKTVHDSGVSFDEAVDVSDDALSRAYAMQKQHDEADGERSEEKINEEKEHSAKNEDTEKNTEEKEAGVDDVAEAILATFQNKEQKENKEEEPATRKQTDAEYLKELERKNTKLYKELQSYKGGESSKESKESTVKTPDVDPEKYAAWVSDTFGCDMDEFGRHMKILNVFKEEYLLPEIASIKASLKQDKLKKTLQDNPLYEKLKSKVADVIKNDARLKGLPEEVQYSLAMDVAQKDHIPAVIESATKKAKLRAKEEHRVIPSERSTVIVKKQVNKDTGLTQEDERLAASWGLSKDDMKKFGGKITLK